MATFNNKFGVPLSGTGNGFENSDVLQPKLKYKFRVLVQDFGGGSGLVLLHPSRLTHCYFALRHPQLHEFPLLCLRVVYCDSPTNLLLLLLPITIAQITLEIYQTKY